MTQVQTLLDDYLSTRDCSPHTAKAIKCDLAKFARWFEAANGERFDPKRVTVRDVADFREHLSRVRRQAVSTTNRALVSIRRFLAHLVQSGGISSNPADAVKEIKRMPTVPKGLSTSEVRKVMREVELRGDARAAAILNLMLFGGLRV